MTMQVNRRASGTTMASRRSARRPVHGPAREARIRRSFDGLVASYIRELSAAGDTTRPRERGIATPHLSSSSGSVGPHMTST
jgi:hypothetical protein